MTIRKDIANAAGVPVPLETLTDSERRALDVLADAGLIPPLPAPRAREQQGGFGPTLIAA